MAGEGRTGRPPNPVSVEERHAREMTEWDKLAARVRKLLEGQMASFEQRLKDAEEGRSTLTLEGQLQITDGLTKLSVAIMRIKAEGQKPREATTAASHDNPEDILRELQGGRG